MAYLKKTDLQNVLIGSVKYTVFTQNTDYLLNLNIKLRLIAKLSRTGKRLWHLNI